MKFSYTQIESYCNELHNVANRMKEILDNVDTSCTSVTNNGLWEGNASNHYYSKAKKLISNFEEVYREMEMSVLYLAKCSEGYQAIDKNIVGEICNNLNITEPNYDSSKIYSGV